MVESRKSLTDADYRALAEFRRLLREFVHFSEDAARTADLAPQKHQALLAIKAYGGPMTVGKLAESLFVVPHSAVGLVDRLVASHLVKRNVNDGDRRKVTLTLTSKAEKTLAALSQIHKEELSELVPKLLEQWKAMEKVARRGSTKV